MASMRILHRVFESALARAVLLGVTTCCLLTCSSPTATPPPPPPPPPPITSIKIIGPDTLLVHQTTLLKVTGETASGDVSVDSTRIAWTSSDYSVATVARPGVVTPLARGPVTITATFGGLEATLQLKINARVRIARMLEPTGKLVFDYGLIPIAVGDTVQFAAFFADLNGSIIGPATARSWSSSAPDVVSVTSSGLATGLRNIPGSIQSWPCTECAGITASTDDGTGSEDVFVTAVTAGLPATVRFAHMAPDFGPLTFFPSQGDPVVLSFGQWVERPITSGSFSVEVDSMPVLNQGENTLTGMVQDSDYLTVYVVAWPPQTDPPLGVLGLVTGAWSRPSAMSPDSGAFRFVSGSVEASAVFVRDLGAPATGTPDLCYFDLGIVTDYYHRAAGDFDVISSQKLTSVDSVRTVISAPAGHKMTYVFVGSTKATFQVIALPDP